MSYDRIIRDALRLARAPRRFASGGNAPLGVDHPDYHKNLENFMSRSVLKDESGKPIRLYHGTSADVAFKRFKKSDRGIWLTENPKEASSYAELNDSMGYKTISTPKELSYERTNTASRVIPVHANITNPYKLTDEDRRNMRTAKSYQSVQSNLFNKARALGHDGVDMGGGVWVAFEPEQVKSAIGNVGTFDPTKKEFGYASGGDVDQPRKLDDMGFYSSAAESARSLPQSKGTPQQMLATMKGVKPAELEWSGVQDKFAGQKSVTKDDLAQHFEQNVPQIKETVKIDGVSPKILNKRNEIKNMYLPELNYYQNLTDPSHPDYKPDNATRRLAEYKAHEIWNKIFEHMEREAPIPYPNPTKHKKFTIGYKYGNESTSERGYREILLRLAGEHKYQPPEIHYDEDNIVAHLRMQDRGPNNNILHLEELQSDWAQEGREKGFKSKEGIAQKNYENKVNELKNRLAEDLIKTGLGREEAQRMAQEATIYKLVKNFPEEMQNIQDLAEKATEENIESGEKFKIEPSPYVTNTDHWVELGLKRALLEAARGGYDKLVWTPGEEQAKRFDLSKRIKRIAYNSKTGDLAWVRKSIFDRPDDDTVDNLENHPNYVDREKLPSLIGKELSKKLLEVKPSNSGWHELGGLDLEIGGEGMKSFYDKMLPSALRRVLKPHTDKIQPTSHVVKGNDGEDVTLPGIEITPELRESILKKGFSYYARGGEVRQHFEVGGGAAGGDSDASGGGFGDSGGGNDSAPEATQDSPAFSTDAPPSYSPPESDPSMLGGATGMAFSSPGSGSLGVGVGNTSGSFLGTAEQQLNTGPGIVGFIGGTPLGMVALGAEKLNEAARAQGYDVVDPGGARPGRGAEQAAREQAAYEAGFPGNRAGGNDSGMIPDPLAPEPSFYGFRLSNDDEETQAGMVKPVGFAPPPAPMMARGGVPRNSHPALSIPGVHIREEIHGRPIFLGERDG